MKRLGTTVEACIALRVDLAELFQMVAAGTLRLTRESEDQPWTVWEIDA